MMHEQHNNTVMLSVALQHNTGLKSAIQRHTVIIGGNEVNCLCQTLKHNQYLFIGNIFSLASISPSVTWTHTSLTDILFLLYNLFY